MNIFINEKHKKRQFVNNEKYLPPKTLHSKLFDGSHVVSLNLDLNQLLTN